MTFHVFLLFLFSLLQLLNALDVEGFDFQDNHDQKYVTDGNGAAKVVIKV